MRPVMIEAERMSLNGEVWAESWHDGAVLDALLELNGRDRKRAAGALRRACLCTWLAMCLDGNASGVRSLSIRRLGRGKQTEMGKECRAVRAVGEMRTIPPEAKPSVGKSYIAGTEPCEGALV